MEPRAPFVAALARGRVVVREEYLEEQLRAHAAELDDVTSLRLTCNRGYFLLRAEMRRGWLQHRLEVPLAVERFRVNRDEQRVVLEVRQDVAVAGRGLLGRLSAMLVQSLLGRTLRSQKQASQLNTISGGAVSLDWPLITVNLQHLRVVRLGMLGRRVGPCLLDIVAVNGCDVRTGEAIIQLGRPYRP
jgi:hypothetical protein